MKRFLAVFAIVIIGGISSQFAEQRGTRASTSLVGTWRLLSAKWRMSDGSVRPDPQPGPNGKGYIMYSDTGRMCAVLANPDRSRWVSEATPSNAEVREAFDGLVSYCGTFDVNEAQGYVVHHIEMDRVPNLAGTDRKRFFVLSGNRLVLRPTPLPAGVQDWTVEFERVTQ